MTFPLVQSMRNTARKMRMKLYAAQHLLAAEHTLPKGKKLLYLHIGIGKTGTTALQVFFWKNRGVLLRKHGITYPSYGVLSAAHHALSPHHPAFLLDKIDFIPVEKWAPVIAKSPSPAILLSSELMLWAPEDCIRHFIHTLETYFDIRLVIYLRRQDHLIVAAYNQQVKTGTQQKTLPEVKESLMRRFDFRARLEPWEAAAGQSRIIIRPFEKQQFHNGDIRCDFLYHAFGIKDYSGFLLDNRNTNPRLSASALEYKRLLNCLFDDMAQRNRFTQSLLEYSAQTDRESTAIHSHPSLLSPTEQREIIRHFHETNSHIARTYCGKTDGALFTAPPPPAAETETSSISLAELGKISTYLKHKAPDLYAKILTALPHASSSHNTDTRQAAEMLTAADTDDGRIPPHAIRRGQRKNRQVDGLQSV